MAWNSSGNLLADRRYAIAEAFSTEGDHAAAADLLAQTVELVPEWAPAWMALAQAHERCGATTAATAAYTRAAMLDGDGALGAALHRDRIDAVPVAALPNAYVQTLFDDYAERFDDHLVGALRYTGPAVIVDALRRSGSTRFGTVLDLGCGTGLVAREMAGAADAIDGIDLSPRMVRQAEATRLYRRLRIDEIEAALRMEGEGSYDTVVAADVLVYVGDLAPVMAHVHRVLRQGGSFAFTVQRGTEQDFVLGADMRFQHAERYLVRTIQRAGLDLVLADPASTRLELGTPVPGLVVVARRP